MRDPSNATHAKWLKRACDLAAESGAVYTFARNAHVLAELHPDDADLAGTLLQLGTVFDNAGNALSAEAEYKRLIARTRDAGLKRATRLAMAALYEREGRSLDALRVLVDLVPLTIPGDAPTTRRAPWRRTCGSCG